MKASFSPNLLRAAATAAVLAGILAAQPAKAAEAVLFGGNNPEAAGITLGGWGSGSAAYTTEEQQGGEGSLRIRTRDFYQGARLDFKTPCDLSPVLALPNAYLAITMKVGTGVTAGPGAVGGPPDAGVLEGGAMPGMGGVPGGPAQPRVIAGKVSKVRVALVGDKDSCELYPLTDIAADNSGWAKVGIPLGELAKRGGFPVKRLVIGGNAADTLYVARIAAVNDDTEIRAEMSASQTNDIHAGDPKDRDARPTVVVFTATAQGGITPLKLTWDFDSKDGIQEEAEGDRVEHSFTKPGRYTVTFTAKPRDDAKKEPAVETLEVEVVP